MRSRPAKRFAMDDILKIGARGHVVLSGRVPLEPRNFMERAMAKNTPADQRDLRDWNQIAAWAGHVAKQLKPS